MNYRKLNKDSFKCTITRSYKRHDDSVKRKFIRLSYFWKEEILRSNEGEVGEPFKVQGTNVPGSSRPRMNEKVGVKMVRWFDSIENQGSNWHESKWRLPHVHLIDVYPHPVSAYIPFLGVSNINLTWAQCFLLVFFCLFK